MALGNFDGVHKGHQRLFELAGEKGHKRAVWTFTTLAKPGVAVPYLTDMQAKLDLFCRYGLDYAVFEEFEDVRDTEYNDFVAKYLVPTFKPSRVVCGFNFRFGRRGAGDAQALCALLAERGVECEIMSPVFFESKAVSSSAVRDAVLMGEMEQAMALLGHPFALKFPVVEGKKLGRQMGMPTINQDFPAGHIIPRHGVYACTVTVDSEVYLAVSNVGTRPTVSGGASHVNCETHIIDYEGDLYYKEIKVEFYGFLRDEIRFDSIDELTAQINKDAICAKEYFACNSRR